MNEYLFIGGPSDGMRKTVEPLPCIKTIGNRTREGHEEETYLSSFFRSKNGEYRVYIHASLQHADPMELLINGYGILRK